MEGYKIRLKEHRGVILEPSSEGFDSGSSTWACMFRDSDDGDYYLYYVGWSDDDNEGHRRSIGVAKSLDGLHFVKCSANPIVSLGDESITPAVFKAMNTYWMVFSFKMNKRSDRRLGIASADDPLGPWMFVRELINPNGAWEANDVDVGPSIVSLKEEEHLVYYSNVTNKQFLGLISLSRPRYWHRRIGILRLRVSKQSINSERYHKNPLSHLNGERGAWNESLFCPGYFGNANYHCLLPAASTYSVGFPYRQYIGLVEDISPFFENPTSKGIIINGPEEKNHIMPNIESEIALDTPSPLLKNDNEELWLYYAVMDRADRIWKIALSVFTVM